MTEDEKRIDRQYRDREMIEELENIKDGQFLALHPWAVRALQRHDPQLLTSIQVRREPGGTGYGLPGLNICERCRGNRAIGQEEFEEMKRNRVRRMMSLWSSFNRQSKGFIYLEDEEGKIRRYPRSQAEREGFSLYGADGQRTAPEEES